MSFYYNRETGRRVSKDIWKRSKAQGGTKYVRSSGKSTSRVSQPNIGARVASAREQAQASDLETTGRAPSTIQDYERLMQDRIKKMDKRRRDDFYQEEYEGPEYETGIDY